jgi:hypothetical protein
MGIHGLWMGDPWISIDDPWISGNPFRHHTARHSSWEDFNHTNLDDLLVRIFANFGISRFPPHPRIPIVFYFMLGGTVDHQGSVWGQLGPPMIILEIFCLSVTFPEIPNSRNIDFLVFPVAVFDEIQGYRCGIDVQSFSNHWFIQKRCFFIDLFMVGVSLASRCGNLLITQLISMALFKFPLFYLAMGGILVIIALSEAAAVAKPRASMVRRGSLGWFRMGVFLDVPGFVKFE